MLIVLIVLIMLTVPRWRESKVLRTSMSISESKFSESQIMLPSTNDAHMDQNQARSPLHVCTA